MFTGQSFERNKQQTLFGKKTVLFANSFIPLVKRIFSVPPLVALYSERIWRKIVYSI